MTDKPTPTDAELKALLLDKLPASKHYIRPVIENVVAAMQAALDKWGQPAQEAEPVAWLDPWTGTKVTTDYDAYGKHGIPLVRQQPVARVPLSEMPYEKRKAIQEGEQISASDAWFKARHEMLDTVDRRNVFRAGFDRGWNAALAANGGNK